MQKKFVLLGFICILFILCLSGCGEPRLGALSGGSSIDAQGMALELDRLMADLTAANQDNYAAYFTPEEYEVIYGKYIGTFGGVGVYLTKEEGADYPLVINTMRGRPADLAGLRPGDYIVSIDGESILSYDVDLVARMVRGEVGSRVELEIYRPEEESREIITITRGLIESESVSGSMLEAESGLAYIAIYDFNGQTPAEFVKIYNELSEDGEIQGLVLDLRNNSGGSVEAALQIASYFVPQGEIIFWQKKADGMSNYRAVSSEKLNLPVVCLQNAVSASASEIVIGALKDHNLAVTVGETSFGKGITQLIYPLESGAALRFTESKYYTPLQYDLHNKGLIPEVAIENPKDFYVDITAPDLEKDLQLQKALEILREE